METSITNDGPEQCAGDPPAKTPDIETLIREVNDACLGADTALIRKAYDFAANLHKGQKRKSGEPYIVHPLSVAMILAELNSDEPTIAAGLLHDVVEDTNTTLDDIAREFSPEVAKLVDGVTKLEEFSNNKTLEIPEKSLPKTKEYRQAENLRKIFVAMAEDIRVIMIKFADRLHNMRTLQFKSEASQKRIANETLTVYAAIASRLGIFKMKWELEDLSFSYLYPEKYNELKRLVDEKMKDKEQLIHETISVIKNAFEEDNVSSLQISGRRKHLYSTWKKISERGKDFSEIYDLFAIRIIVETVEECYKVLGIIHRLWKPMEDRIKDYIANPKSNSYRSLHTTVYVKGEPMEIQIRTMAMHMVNEYGPAAHWAYKERLSSAGRDFPWLNRIIEWQKDSVNALDFVNNAMDDANESNIYVYTPKGKVVDLPPGSTPIDFAYTIHTDVGHKCIGARVNSVIVPLSYRLKNAEFVEIMTSNTASPKLDWLKICRTLRAQTKIKQWFKKEKRQENIIRGRDLLKAELKRTSRKDKRISEVLLSDTQLLTKTAEKLNYASIDDLIASVGYRETSTTKIIQKISEFLPKEPEKALEPIKAAPTKEDILSKGVKVQGMDNILVVFAKCCNPIPGDEIIGIWKFGTGVSVHRTNCRNVNADRSIEVEWAKTIRTERKYPVKLELEAWDRNGISAECINIINEMRIPLHEYNSKLKNGKDMISMSIEVLNKSQLDIIIRKLSKINGMLSVSRASSRKRI